MGNLYYDYRLIANRNLFGISIILLCLVVIFSCNSNMDDSFSEEKIDASLLVADSIFSDLTDVYNENPDSVPIIAKELESKFKSENNNRELVRLYSFMSEYYQHRKMLPDIALEYLIKALDMAVQNPDLKFDRTYLYINVGNIMYSYGLYLDAIYIYKQIPKITDVSDRPAEMALIYNNIALSFQQMNQTDSAKYYFNKTLPYIEKLSRRRIIFLVQYYNYMSSLAYRMEEYNLMPQYYQEAIGLLNGIDMAVENLDNPQVKTYYNDIRLDYYGNRIKALDWMGLYSLEKDMIDSAVCYWNEAKALSLSSKDSYRCIEINLNLADAYSRKMDLENAMSYVDTAINMIFERGKNYNQLENAYRTKSNILILMNDDIESKVAEKLADAYLDSLIMQQNNNDFIQMKIELAVKPVQLEMKDVEVKKSEQEQTIRSQYLLIKILVGIILLIIIAFVVYYRLYLSLKRTRFQLAERTIEKISKKEEDRDKSTRLSDSVEQELLAKFEIEVVTNKAFLESNINLQLIASRLDTNRSYISKMVNTVYKMNFNDYINKLRINEACKIIYNNTDPNFTIDHLYSEVGFVGKSTFYTAFKKYTGVTPAVFFKMNNQAI